MTAKAEIINPDFFNMDRNIFSVSAGASVRVRIKFIESLPIHASAVRDEATKTTVASVE